MQQDGCWETHQTLYANLIENLCYFNLTLGSNVTVCLRGWALARHTRLKVWRQFNLSTACRENFVNKYPDAKLINCWKERCHHKVEFKTSTFVHWLQFVWKLWHLLAFQKRWYWKSDYCKGQDVEPWAICIGRKEETNTFCVFQIFICQL